MLDRGPPDEVELTCCVFFFFFCQYYPGALYLLAIWYTRKEIATRIAVLYSAQMAGLSFSNLIAAGVFEGLNGARGLAGWRWYVSLYMLVIGEGT